MKKLVFNILIIVTLCAFFSSLAHAYPFALERPHPVAYEGINANFGQYRNYGNGHTVHKGIDYRAGWGIPIYAVAGRYCRRGPFAARCGRSNG